MDTRYSRLLPSFASAGTGTGAPHSQMLGISCTHVGCDDVNDGLVARLDAILVIC